RVRGLVLANPWVRSEAGAAAALVRHYYGQRLLQRGFWTKLFSGEGRPLAAFGDFLRSLRRANRGTVLERSEDRGTFVDRMAEGFDSFVRPVLLIASGRDLTAREFDGLCQSAPRWNDLVARLNVAWTRLPDADHTFSSSSSLRAAIESMVRWIRELPAG